MDLEATANASEGMSGSDVLLLAKEAAMRPLRRLMSCLDLSQGGLEMHAAQTDGAASSSDARARLEQAVTRRAGAAIDRVPSQRQAVSEGPSLLGPVTVDDLAAALQTTKPTGGVMLSQYARFTAEYGQTM